MTANEVCTEDCLGGLRVIIVEQPKAQGVYANIVVFTPMEDLAPRSMASCMMIHGGSAEYGPAFVQRLAREICGGFVNSSVSYDRTTFTATTDTDCGLYALLPPYLDSIFFTKFSKDRWDQVAADAQASAAEMDDEWLTQIYPKSSIYSRHPLDTKHASALTLAGVQEYHKKFYTLRNSVIVIGGKVKKREALDVLEALRENMLAPCDRRPENPSPLRPLESGTPVLIQPTLPTLPKPPSKAGGRQPLSPPAGGPSLDKKLVRFLSVLGNPLNAAPKIPQVAVRGDLSLLREEMFDIHYVFQGPKFTDYLDSLAFQFLAQHICRSFNELVGDFNQVDFMFPESQQPNTSTHPSPTHPSSTRLSPSRLGDAGASCVSEAYLSPPDNSVAWKRPATKLASSIMSPSSVIGRKGVASPSCTPSINHHHSSLNEGAGDGEMSPSPLSNFSVGAAAAYSLNTRARLNPLAILSSCGVTAAHLCDTLNKLPEYIHATAREGPNNIAQPEIIEQLIYNAWLMHRDEYEYSGEYMAVTLLSQWAAFTSGASPQVKQECLRLCSDFDRAVDTLKAKPATFWSALYNRYFTTGSILVVRKTNNDILSSSTLTRTTSAAGGMIETELIREKEWENFVDGEVDRYLKSLGI